MKEDARGLISILICSRDRRDQLESLVSSLWDMKTGHPFEVVVVEETDQPRPLEGVCYIPHPVADRGIPYARNLALSRARGDIVVFLDDDCVIHAGWLDNLLAPFESEAILGVQGGVTVPPGTSALGWAESLLGVPGGGITRVLQAGGADVVSREISTLNCAYRRRAVQKAGGFEKSLRITGEDYILAKQVCRDGACLFVPGALVSHEARGSLTPIWHWFVRRGRSEIDVIRSGKQKDIGLSTVLRGALSVKLLLLFLLWLALPVPGAILFPAAALAYALLQYVRFFRVWRQSPAPWTALVLLPLVKLDMDLAMDWGRFRGLVFD